MSWVLANRGEEGAGRYRLCCVLWRRCGGSAACARGEGRAGGVSECEGEWRITCIIRCEGSDAVWNLSFARELEWVSLLCVCVCVVPVLTCVDVPFEEFEGASALPALVKEGLSTAEAVYVLCRLGNDSQIVTRMLKDAGVAGGHVWDVKGGIREWARTAPEGFPEY